MTILELPNTILGWVGIVSAILLAITFFLYQIRRNDLSLLRESITDLSKRVDYLEKENSNYKEENSILKSQLATTKAKKDYLKTVVIQGVALQATMNKQLLTDVNEKLNKK